MKKQSIALFLTATSALGVVLSAGEAKANAWYLIYTITNKTQPGTYGGALPMATLEMCEAAGKRLEKSGKSGNFDKNAVDKVAFECVEGLYRRQ